MEYFKPKLFLGMTATPDKRDDNIAGKNVYELFNHQIAHEIRLQKLWRIIFYVRFTILELVMLLY